MNSPILNTAGEVLYIIHHVQDITESVKMRLRHEEHLRATEKHKEQAAQAETQLALRSNEVEAIKLKVKPAETSTSTIKRKSWCSFYGHFAGWTAAARLSRPLRT